MENKKYIWLTYNYKGKNIYVNFNRLKPYIINIVNEFYSEIMEKLNINQYIYITLKIKTKDNLYLTISNLQKVNKNDKNLLIDILVEFWNLRKENYVSKYLLLENLFLFYLILDVKEKDVKNETKISKSVKQIDKKDLKISGFNLPKTMDLKKWGQIIYLDDNKKVIISKSKSLIKYHINILENSNIVEYKIGEKVLLKFEDSIYDKNDLNTFTRVIFKNNHKYYYKKGKIIIKKYERKCNFMEKISLNPTLNINFLVIDIETRDINNIKMPICISIFDGKLLNSYFISNFKNAESMFKEALQSIMKRKYDGYRIYLHNFSNFDGVYLLRILTELTDSNNIKFIKRDAHLIDIKFYFGDNKNKMALYFRDSYLLLPVSLKNLSYSFNLENKKGIFPYKFINNKFINLNYVGNVPSFKYFKDITIEEYKNYRSNYKNNLWNLKIELIKYCELDVKVLYNVLYQFNDFIYENFRLNINDYPTLSSLALGIFRSNFLKDDCKIPLIGGIMYNNIKQGYTGGSVDIFKPYGKNIYRYDVNSLYPFIMLQYPMPVGNPIYFEGNILEIEDNPYGFFEVEVTAPDNIINPILQYRFKTSNNYRTISPIGKWTGMYHSEEINNAIINGYKFKILRGFIFEKEYIFDEYIKFFYNIKMNSQKGTANYIISKLLMNGLYGRFGMNPTIINHEIIDSENSIKYLNKYDIIDLIELNNGKTLISYNSIENENDINDLIEMNICVAISASITAFGRIFMSQFKNNKNFNLYYTDTDSIDIDNPLPDHFISKELGMMKLEHIFNKIIFLAPKVYGGKTSKYEYVKVKGLKTKLKFNKLYNLLNKNSKLEIYQEKWYKDFSNGYIKVRNELYTLMITENKRKIIFDNNNKFVDTKPFIVKNNEII